MDPAADPVPDDDEFGAGVDARFTMANERTFLAWIRTSLGFVTAGLAVTLFFRPFTLPYGRRIIGVPLILLGAVIAAFAYREWGVVEQAMREGRPLPRSRLGLVVTVGIIATALIAAVLVAIGTPGGTR